MNITPYKLTLALMAALAIHDTAAGSPLRLGLDSCRTLAIDNCKALRIADMEKLSAHYAHRSAVTNYLPKISATGMYMHTGREISLLSDRQKATLSGIGDALAMPALNAVGEGLVDALRTDTRNLGAAAVMLTQPIYMGGKIRAYDSITRYAERIAADRHNQAYQQLIVEVDETYWQIVSLTARRKLAESYLKLVETLHGDISQMIDAGLATKSDGLSVSVKVNEAKVAIIQVDNGVELLKMHMAQLCGLAPDTPLALADEETLPDYGSIIPAEAMSAAETTEIDRPELSALSWAVKISDAKVRIAASEFLPTVALTGGYAATYPSVFNSFEKKMKGMWNVGIVMKVPLLTWGDRSYKVKEARAEAAATRLQLEETREKVELQVSQCRRKLTEAREKLTTALSSQQAADENLRYATLGLKEGVIPVSNVIEAQTAWLSARTTLITSGIDLRLAYVYLKKSLGAIK